MEGKIEFDREKFLFTVMNQFMNKDSQGVRRSYDGFINLIKAGQEKDLKNGAEHNYSADEEKRKILEMCLDMFRNSEIRDLITKGNLGVNQVFSMFKERILGDNKRQYDISSLYDESIIADRSDNEGKCVKFIKEDGIENSFTDLNKQTVRIKCIGRLQYKNQFGEESYVTKYKVTKPTKGNEAETFEVYSNIIIPEMTGNAEYKEVVLNELLSENNIKLSNASGYIGAIAEDHSMNVGTEDKNRTRYKYKASPNYMLLCETDEASAVMEYEREEKTKSEQPNDIGEER